MEALGKRRERAKAIARELRRLFPEARVFLTHNNPWELLVAVILSAQCTDRKVNEVTNRLFRKYKTFRAYLRVVPREFEKDVRETGFFRTKTKHILAAARAIKERHGGAVPRTMDELTALPGVGRKTANIVLWNAFEILSGIPVDTHVKRLALRFGLTDKTDPEKIERDLMEVLPRKEWGTISYRMIEYGRKFCPARSHDHSRCPLSRYE